MSPNSRPGHPGSARLGRAGRSSAGHREIGQHSKTDGLDARGPAHHAEAVRPQARDLPDEATRGLRAPLDRRRQPVAMRGSEQDRLKQGPTATVQADLEAHVAYPTGPIEAMDGPIGESIEAEAEWKLRDEVPGTGPRTSRTPPGLLPGLGKLTGEQVSALAGLASRARDSGTVKGARTIFGGRAEVRTALYMASVSAMRFNPELRSFYKRLRGNAKEAKVALVAVARKLLTIANAMIRGMKPWTSKITCVAA